MDNIINKLALKYNMDSDLLERIVRSEFKFIADTMSEGNYESVHLQYFGKVAVKPKRLNVLKKEIDVVKANNNI